MNICVYGASSNDIDKSYIDQVFCLGELIADHGHNLIFGAGGNGLMGAVARGVHSKGGKVTGVTPTFFDVDGILYEDCTEIIETETMRQRKQIMEESSDAFIMVPGGIGTFEEFFEILTLKQLGRHGKAIVIFNINGFFDTFLTMLSETAQKGFMSNSTNEIYTVLNTPEEIISYLETYIPEVGHVFKF